MSLSPDVLVIIFLVVLVLAVILVLVVLLVVLILAVLALTVLAVLRVVTIVVLIVVHDSSFPLPSCSMCRQAASAFRKLARLCKAFTTCWLSVT